MKNLKRILLAAFVASGMSYAGYSLAQSGAQVLTSVTSTETISCASCTVSAVWPANVIWGANLLYTTTGTSGTTGTTAEQTLASYSLPANTLGVGTKLRINASFTAAADANNKTFKCYFGASVITSGTLTTNNKNGSCSMVVTKTATNKQTVYANMLVDTTAITGYVNFGTDTDTSAITIKFTGQNGTASAGDIVLNDFSVERLGK